MACNGTTYRHFTDGETLEPGVHKSWAPSRPGAYNFIRWCLILVYVGPQYGTCFMYPSGASNFDVAPRFLEKSCTLLLDEYYKFATWGEKICYLLC